MKEMTNDECRMTKWGRDLLAMFHSSFDICHSTLLLAFCLQVHAATNDTNTASRNIGIEGKVTVALPRPDYKPRPLDDRTELILRIEGVKPLPNGQHNYEFFYMGLEPGLYKLADYLVRPDGSRADELGDLRIQVRSLLPEDHDGRLNSYVPRPFPFVGGYRAALVALAVLWIVGLAAFIIAFRKKRPPAMSDAIVSAPSLADRMRPLVESAAAGRLTAQGQAELERLLMAYWREKLSFADLRMAEALHRLKTHAEAGELLRAVERWLHHPGGASVSEVTSLLQPYRNVHAPAAEGAAP